MGEWGYGALIYGNPDDEEQSECSAASHFYSYKIRGYAISGGYRRGPRTYSFSSMVLFDSEVGMGVGWAGNDNADSVMPKILIEKNKFYAQSIIPDCPHGGNAGVCFT